MNLIVARRMEHTVHGGKHIASVKLQSGAIYTRQEILDLMRQGHEFHSYAKSGHMALVVPKRCGHCNLTYLTTTADQYLDDNLDRLPPY